MSLEMSELFADTSVKLELKQPSNDIKEVAHAYKLKKIDKELPSVIKNVNKSLPEGSSLVLAGGAIASLFNKQEINDYDVYLVTNIEDDVEYTDLLSLIVEDFTYDSRFVSCTDKSLLVNCDGMLINFVFFKKFNSIEEIFDSFDFTCVMGAYNLTTKKFHVTESFLLDNISKIIRFNHKTSFPIMSLLRVKKYVDRGFEISRNEMLKICLKISQLNIKSFKGLKKHIGGMYGIDIEKLFDTTKEFNIDEVITQINEMDFEYDTSIDNDSDYAAFHLLKLSLSTKKSRYTYIDYNNSILLIRCGVLIGVVSKGLLEGEKVKIYPHSGKFKAYKYVLFKDGELVSHREKDFVYKLGKTLLPKVSSTGLFCGSLNRKSNFTYSGDRNSALIELLVEPKDIKNISSYERHMTKIGVSNMEVNKFVFNKVITLPDGAILNTSKDEKQE